MGSSKRGSNYGILLDANCFRNHYDAQPAEARSGNRNRKRIHKQNRTQNPENSGPRRPLRSANSLIKHDAKSRKGVLLAVFWQSRGLAKREFINKAERKIPKRRAFCVFFGRVVGSQNENSLIKQNAKSRKGVLFAFFWQSRGLANENVRL